MGKNNKTTNGKVTLNVGKIVAAYRILTTPANEQIGRDGIRLSALEPKDINIVIRVINTLEPEAERFEKSRKNAAERLKPENWSEITEKFSKFNDLADDDKIAVNKAFITYENSVNECMQPELDKDREIDAYEHLSADAFGTFVKSNGHILNDMPSVRLLQTILG